MPIHPGIYSPLIPLTDDSKNKKTKEKDRSTDSTGTSTYKDDFSKVYDPRFGADSFRPFAKGHLLGFVPGLTRTGGLDLGAQEHIDKAVYKFALKLKDPEFAAELDSAEAAGIPLHASDYATLVNPEMGKAPWWLRTIGSLGLGRLGAVVGGGAGTLLSPGVGTVAGAALGAELGHLGDTALFPENAGSDIGAELLTGRAIGSVAGRVVPKKVVGKVQGLLGKSLGKARSSLANALEGTIPRVPHMPSGLAEQAAEGGTRLTGARQELADLLRKLSAQPEQLRTPPPVSARYPMSHLLEPLPYRGPTDAEVVAGEYTDAVAKLTGHPPTRGVSQPDLLGAPLKSQDELERMLALLTRDERTPFLRSSPVTENPVAIPLADRKYVYRNPYGQVTSDEPLNPERLRVATEQMRPRFGLQPDAPWRSVEPTYGPRTEPVEPLLRRVQKVPEAAKILGAQGTLKAQGIDASTAQIRATMRAAPDATGQVAPTSEVFHQRVARQPAPKSALAPPVLSTSPSAEVPAPTKKPALKTPKVVSPTIGEQYVADLKLDPKSSYPTPTRVTVTRLGGSGSVELTTQDGRLVRLSHLDWLALEPRKVKFKRSV